MINLTHRKLGKGYNQEIHKEKQLIEKPVQASVFLYENVNVELWVLWNMGRLQQTHCLEQSFLDTNCFALPFLPHRPLPSLGIWFLWGYFQPMNQQSSSSVNISLNGSIHTVRASKWQASPKYKSIALQQELNFLEEARCCPMNSCRHSDWQL